MHIILHTLSLLVTMYHCNEHKLKSTPR